MYFFMFVYTKLQKREHINMLSYILILIKMLTISLTFHVQKYTRPSYCRSVNQFIRRIISKCMILFEMLSLYKHLYIY